jgi:hypothetical protein
LQEGSNPGVDGSMELPPAVDERTPLKIVTNVAKPRAGSVGGNRTPLNPVDAAKERRRMWRLTLSVAGECRLRGCLLG